MPHFRVQIDPVQISVTSDALGPNIYPSLKLARAGLDHAIDGELQRIVAGLTKGIEALKLAANESYRDLRAQRKIALKVRESDLPSDEPAIATVEVSPEQQRTNELARAALGSKHDEPNADDEAA